MNIVALTGRATRDIELRFTPNGKAVANGAIAVQRRFKDQNGEYQADFFDFVAWNKTAELMTEYIKKGEQFGITGELQTRIWDKDDGTKVKITEINVGTFDFPVRSKSGNTEKPKAQESGPFANDGQTIDISDEDLPF